MGEGAEAPTSLPLVPLRFVERQLSDAGALGGSAEKEFSAPNVGEVFPSGGQSGPCRHYATPPARVSRGQTLPTTDWGLTGVRSRSRIEEVPESQFRRRLPGKENSDGQKCSIPPFSPSSSKL